MITFTTYKIVLYHCIQILLFQGYSEYSREVTNQAIINSELSVA